MYIDSRDLVKARVLDFLEKYGDKGFIVLKTAIEISLSNTNNRRFGDFSYQSLVFRLNSMGIGYNPSNILRILEREYGVIEKTYSSSRQKWYRFIDLDAVREALYEYSYGTSDPRIRILKIKYNSLEPYSLLQRLRQIAFKQVLSSSDREFVKRIAFKELDLIVELIEEMSNYSGYFTEEIRVLNEIIEYAGLASEKIACCRRSVGRVKSIETTVYVER